MSMTVDSRAPSSTGPEGAALGPRPRTPSPQFIALSDLSRQSLTARDLLPLVPATFASLIFNALFVTALLLFNVSPSTAHTTQQTLLDSDTKLQDPKKDKSIIDDEPEPLLDPTTETSAELKIPGVDPQLDALPGLKPPDKDQDAMPGIGSGSESGIQGDDVPNKVPGIPGFFTHGDTLGAPGESGAGLGGDIGLPDAMRGGSRDKGGFGPRNSADRLKYAKGHGASDESERAVLLGLKWLSVHQSPDGRWSLDQYHKFAANCKCRNADVEGSVMSNDTAGTALGLLPFLGAGHTHKQTSTYTKNVLASLQYLMSRQGSNGDLGGGMYSHALGTIALCEAYAMTSDPKLRQPAQRALQFIEYAQNVNSGGWRYQPRTDGDTSVVAWQVMALRSGQMATLNVSSKTLDLARKWLDSCQIANGAQYQYTPGSGATYPMTAAALLNRQYMGWGPRKPELHKGCEFILKNLPPAKGGPREKLGPIYYYYYASQVMHHMGDKYWETWNPLMRELLIRTQEKDGHAAGSWNPDGVDHGGSGGRIYSTSLALLTLEVYYRHLPLYRRESASSEMEAPVEKKDEPKEMKKDEPKKDDAKKEASAS